MDPEWTARRLGPVSKRLLLRLKRGPLRDWRTNQTIQANRLDLIKKDRYNRLVLTRWGRTVAKYVK